MELPFNDLSSYWKNKFGKKTLKVILDGNFTCPNRDGLIGTDGCVFCDSFGSISPQFRGSNQIPIKEQIDIFMTNAKKDFAYIGYFQSFSSTYGPIEKLEKVFSESIAHPLITGLSIGTRPDCINDSVIELLSTLNKIKPIIVELGVQTFNDDDLEFIKRGHGSSDSITAIQKLKAVGIETVIHLILGLPNETDAIFLQNIEMANQLDVDGVKFHELHVLKNTCLAQYFFEGKIKILSQDEYINKVIMGISRLNPKIVIHRLCANIQIKDELIAPTWTMKSSETRNKIINIMKEKNIKQGSSL